MDDWVILLFKANQVLVMPHFLQQMLQRTKYAILYALSSAHSVPNNMTTSTPLRKANQLIESINEMVMDGVNKERVDEIVDDANKMKEFGQYTDAYNVLGMVAALHGDLPEVDRLFTAAIRSGGRESWTLCNYAAALSNLNQSTEAVKIIDEVVDMSPDDLYVIHAAIKYHREAYDIDGVQELINRCVTLGQSFVDPMMERDLKILKSLMVEHNVTWLEMASRIELGASALRRLGLQSLHDREAIGNEFMFYEFRIDADVNSVAMAESAINDAIAEEAYSPVDDFLYLTCATI